jgi:hypothetical protein
MSIYRPGTLGTAANNVQFNNFTASPVFRVQSRSPEKWAIRQQDLPVPFESGSSDFLTLLGDTAYIIQGTMYPSSEANYDEGLMQLRSVASLELEQADILSNDGYVPYIWGNAGGVQQQIFLKPLYCQLVETTKQGFVQPFTIYCKVIDPVVYGGTLKTASTGQTNPTAGAGGSAYSFTYPVLYGSTLYTVSANCNNIGTLPSYPVSIIVNGPVTNPVVTLNPSGQYIGVNVTLSSSSDQLNIVYSKTKRNVNLNGVNVENKITTGSTFFKIPPGTSTIQLSGSSVGTGAVAVVDYFDSWPLA